MQEPYNQCSNGLSSQNQCNCLEDQIQSILGTPGFPQVNWGGGCYLYYEYEIDNVCAAYENGSSFNYTASCSALCYVDIINGNPCAPYDGPKSMGVGNFNTDKESLSNKIEQKAVNTYYSDIQPLENKYEPDLCLLELEAEVDLLNATTQCILDKCCAPWIIEEKAGTPRLFNSSSSVKCLSCKYSQKLPKVDFKKIKDPDWKPPNPKPEGCAPPPPPPPPATPPQIPTDCINGGGTDGTPDTGGGFPGGGGQQD